MRTETGSSPHSSPISSPFSGSPASSPTSAPIFRFDSDKPAQSTVVPKLQLGKLAQMNTESQPEQPLSATDSSPPTETAPRSGTTSTEPSLEQVCQTRTCPTKNHFNPGLQILEQQIEAPLSKPATTSQSGVAPVKLRKRYLQSSECFEIVH